MSSSTDSIAEFFTRIRNANHIRAEKVDIPASKNKLAIARIFKQEGYISNYKIIEDRKQGILRVYLKYTAEGNPVLNNIKRVSRPGLRIYRGKNEIPQVYRGLGTVIVSTARGILTDTDCRGQGIGGEIIGYVW